MLRSEVRVMTNNPTYQGLISSASGDFCDGDESKKNEEHSSVGGYILSRISRHTCY